MHAPNADLAIHNIVNRALPRPVPVEALVDALRRGEPGAAPGFALEILFTEVPAEMLDRFAAAHDIPRASVKALYERLKRERRFGNDELDAWLD
ncbi:MAG: hypothetical protein HQL38_04895 [Alphaproteobacteria bacterium]|nr:hypothetical protein [Alphaproteobacteria bacterium]MBF0375462.1 hypothetical protein [Alphaproteobacteria bacterium]MBF0391999.1 hypothetical protein [Alphaproteobacteria bacterium]